MEMTMRERKPYYREVAKRYRKAGKKEKGVILDEFVATVGLNRSYASTLLRTDGKVVYTRRGIRLKSDKETTDSLTPIIPVSAIVFNYEKLKI
jgi:hypothetical protein